MNTLFNKIRELNLKNVFYAIPSVPCFEYWLLLHFELTTSPYSATGRKSVGDLALSELQHYFPEYTKGSNGVFLKLIGKLAEAKTHAQLSLKEAKENATDNPSTYIHELIEYLQNIKNL